MKTLVKRLEIPEDMRRLPPSVPNPYFDFLELYEDKLIGYRKNKPCKTWLFKKYKNLWVFPADIFSPHASVVFSKTNEPELWNSLTDTDRIFICCGKARMKETNAFADQLKNEISLYFKKSES